MVGLEVLDVFDNLLEFFFDSICKLFNLIELNVFDNKIKFFLGKMESLKQWCIVNVEFQFVYKQWDLLDILKVGEVQMDVDEFLWSLKKIDLEKQFFGKVCGFQC